MTSRRNQHSRIESISFTPGPTRPSTLQTESEKTEQQRTNDLLMFGWAVEPGDMDTSEGTNASHNEDRNETA
jgi:hypothetical protein